MNARTPGLWPPEDNAATGWVGVQVHRLNTHSAPADHAEPDHVIDEQPVALVFNGLSHVVMMATPTHLEDLGVGFAMSEGLIADVGALRDVSVERHAQGLSVHLEVSPQAFARLKDRRRQLAGRTGCGLCGIDSLQAFEQALPTASVHDALRAPGDLGAALRRALQALPSRQTLQAHSGGCHAAAWATPEGELVCVREDVGRHNALDKLIGAMALQGPLPAGLVVVSSRASHEMVSKCVRVGLGTLGAISAPTSLAIALAQRSGLRLFGFCRGDSVVAYA